MASGEAAASSWDYFTHAPSPSTRASAFASVFSVPTPSSNVPSPLLPAPVSALSADYGAEAIGYTRLALSAPSRSRSRGAPSLAKSSSSPSSCTTRDPSSRLSSSGKELPTPETDQPLRLSKQLKKRPSKNKGLSISDSRLGQQAAALHESQSQDIVARVRRLSIGGSSDGSASSSSPPVSASPSVEDQLSQQSLYKTELCRSFEETGACRYGLKCQFAHGKAELRPVARHPKYKTEMCKTWQSLGTCPYGTRCRFIHNKDDEFGAGFVEVAKTAVEPTVQKPSVASSRLAVFADLAADSPKIVRSSQ